VYSVDIDSEVDEQISALPAAALPSFAELMVLLEIALGVATPITGSNPTPTCAHRPSGPTMKAW
jgi:hypothetical protein